MGYTLCQASSSGVTSTANTDQFWRVCGHITVSTTEANSDTKFQNAGDLSGLYVVLFANSVAATSTFTLRKNAGDLTQVVSPGSSAIGDFEDTTHTDTIAAADKICLKTHPGAASGTYQFAVISLVFAATTDTVTKLGTDRFTFATASTSTFANLHGGAASTTEANHKCRMRKAGSLKKLGIYVSGNRAQATTVRSRKNAGNGNLVITVTGGGAAGWYEDTSNSDTIGAGEDWNYSLTTGTGTDTLTVETISSEFISTNNDGICICSEPVTGFTVADNTDRFFNISGRDDWSATETSADTKIRKAFAMSELTTLITANDVSSASTCDLRKGAASTVVTMSITGSTAAVFSDSTHTYTAATTDLINTRLSVPSVSGSHSVTSRNTIVYTNLVALTRISASLTLKWNIVGRISKALILKWNIVGRITKSLILKWNINGRISKALILKWNITGRISKALTLKWNIIGRISKSLILKWNIIGRISKSLTLKWNILNYITKSLILKWNINGRISKSLILKWNIIGRISKALTLKWNIVGRISKDLTLKWNILGRISKSLILKWNILNYVSKSLVLKWDIVGRISKPLTLKWNILGRVSKPLTLKWDIIGRISKSLTLKWDIVGRVSKSLTLIWVIMEPGLERVSKSLILKWDVIGRVSKPLTLKWDIINRVSKSLTLKWNVLNYVSKSLTLKWNIVNRISKSLVLKWDIIGRISKPLTLKWDVIGRVSKPLTLKWNVIERVSKSLRLKWNVLNYVSKSLTLKWNVLSHVSKSLTLKWNIIERVSKSLTLKWDVIEIPTTLVSKVKRWIFTNYSESDPAKE